MEPFTYSSSITTNVTTFKTADDQSPCLETVTFCKKKIEHIRGCLPLGSSNADPVQSRPKINHCHNGEADPMWVGNVAKIENLKIENLLHNMSKVCIFMHKVVL